MKILLATANPALALMVKRTFARFRYEWTSVDNGFDAFQTALSHKFNLLVLDCKLPRMMPVEILRRLASVQHYSRPAALVLTLSDSDRHEIEKEHFPKVDIVSGPVSVRLLVSQVQRILHQEQRLVCLGGGTGLFTLLSGLKTLPAVHLSSIVSMSDDGGSTGILRDQFGMLPPGDIRRSLVALSKAPDLLNHLMQYRFRKGKGLEGHNLGNLLITALSDMRGSMTGAIRAIGEILDLQGEVIPVTETVNTLKAELENGSIIEGEHRIDLFEGQDPKNRIIRLWQEPRTAATPDALEAIYNANFLILGPGDLFTSILSNLIVDGVAEAIRSSRAKKIYICNVMTKPGETTDFQVSDHVQEIVRYLKTDVLDYVLCSSTKFHKAIVEIYSQKHQDPVVERHKERIAQMTKAHVVWADVASEQELVRHDSLKLAAELRRILDQVRAEGDAA